MKFTSSTLFFLMTTFINIILMTSLANAQERFYPPKNLGMGVYSSLLDTFLQGKKFVRMANEEGRNKEDGARVLLVGKVSVQDYRAIMGDNPSHDWRTNDRPTDPVTHVSEANAITFVTILNWGLWGKNEGGVAPHKEKEYFGYHLSKKGELTIWKKVN